MSVKSKQSLATYIFTIIFLITYTIGIICGKSIINKETADSKNCFDDMKKVAVETAENLEINDDDSNKYIIIVDFNNLKLDKESTMEVTVSKEDLSISVVYPIKFENGKLIVGVEEGIYSSLNSRLSKFYTIFTIIMLIIYIALKKVIIDEIRNRN